MSKQPSSAKDKAYLCIDLKSFYASVECVDRGLDPLSTDLVVADLSRTEKTICLAVSPSLKAKGVRNRCRFFEIPDHLRSRIEVAPPRMARYIEKSAEIYGVYLRWLAKEDIHVYSIDEAFMDVTGYLGLYGCGPRELGERIRADVTSTTGIPATCGLGTNLYLAKVALDISAKHAADFFGELDEERYKETLWAHRPITDFWRVGGGTARRLAELGIHTMGQLALHPTEPIYRAFGIDAEILIDHAWGIEPVTIADIKAYRSRSHSLSSAQVLGSDRDFEGALLIAKEMADALALELVEQGKCARSLTVAVNYSASSEQRHALGEAFRGEEAGALQLGLRTFYGSTLAHGTTTLLSPTSSRSVILAELASLFARVVEHGRPIHRVAVSLDDVRDETTPGLQMSLFRDEAAERREKTRQQAISDVKRKFGRNALLKGIDLLDGATARERNLQIGGHRSGEE